MTLRHLLLMPMNKILNCKDHQIYSKMLRKICIYVKRKSNISFRVIKNSSFDQRFLMVKTFLKIIWWRFLVLHSEHLLVSSATLPCTYDKIFWLCQCKYTIIQMWLFKFLTYAHFTVGLFQFINNQGFKWN